MKRRTSMKNKNYIYTLASAFMLLDQIIKLIVINNMEISQEIKIIPKFFSLFYLRNTGAAFSIFGNKTLFLIIISIVCLIVLKNYIKKLKRVTNLTIISLGILIGGIIGNLFDRVLRQAVIDYLSFNFFGYSFPVFNLADIGITIGALLLIIDLLIEEKEKKISKV
jgi:signal peptidase II